MSLTRSQCILPRKLRKKNKFSVALWDFEFLHRETIKVTVNLNKINKHKNKLHLQALTSWCTNVTGAWFPSNWRQIFSGAQIERDWDLTGWINVKHPVGVSTHYQIWWWEEEQRPAVEKYRFWPTISTMERLISKKFSVFKTIICYEQSGLIFVYFVLCQSLQKLRCLEGVQGRIELMHTRTLE